MDNYNAELKLAQDQYALKKEKLAYWSGKGVGDRLREAVNDGTAEAVRLSYIPYSHNGEEMVIDKDYYSMELERKFINQEITYFDLQERLALYDYYKLPYEFLTNEEIEQFLEEHSINSFTLKGESLRLKSFTNGGFQYRAQGGEPGKRGSVSQWLSRRSQLRLKTSLYALDWKNVNKECVYEMTLTYPYKVYDIEESKEDLRVFLQYIGRKYEACGYWKMEYSTNGHIHYHVLLITSRPIELGDYYIITEKGVYRAFARGKRGKDRKWIKRSHFISSKKEVHGMREALQCWWSARVDPDNRSCFNSGIAINKVRSVKRIGSYFAEYISDTKGRKQKQNIAPADVEHSGRWWGMFNRKKLDVTVFTGQISLQVKRQVNKLISQYMEKTGYKGKLPYVLFFNSEDEEAQEIAELIKCVLKQEVSERDIRATTIKEVFKRKQDISERYGTQLELFEDATMEDSRG